MSVPYNFRTAFNGFNREDVVHYIEYIHSNHNNQLAQLKADLAAARKELAAVRALPVQDDKVAELTARCQEQDAVIAQLRGELEALRQAPAAAVPVATADELEAYRRAERVERQARERSEAVYQQATGILADATARVDEATGELSGIADQVAAQLDVLREAVGASKVILAETAAALAAIRPGEE